ncbi:MAG: DUF2161 family putative PD-(D/E)XK-type phosphodiesterase [Candidatus Adiutrix sp.]|jgi:hypothetical protein|nr:DUF2161 family putative PD-(D/E)XK-type phosphodiesterase [Candidatus Adiutrix sp.]
MSRAPDESIASRTKASRPPGRLGGRSSPLVFPETDLYPPLKKWLEKSGYTVRAEVNGCDVAALRGRELALIELKRAINLDLLLQLVRRQEAEASVYAAVPAPKKVDKRWRELCRLLKRLEVGLILIYLDSPRRRVELAFHPQPRDRRRRKQATRALLAEMSGRCRDLNQGGSTRRKLVTAYREAAVGVAAALSRLGPCSPKALREAGASPKCAAILLKNHYGWFERPGRGLYALNDAGRAALVEYAELLS